MIKKYFYLFWHRHIEPIDPFNLQFKQAVKTSIATSISALIAFQIQKLPVQNGIWLMMGGFFIMQMYVGDSYKERFFTQLIFSIVATVMLLISSVSSQYFILFCLLMIISTYTAFYVINYHPGFFRPILFILILILFGGYRLSADITSSWHQIIYFLIGGACAIIIANTLWPFRLIKILPQNSQKVFRDLSAYIQFVLDDSVCGNIHHLRRYKLKNTALKTIQNSRKLIIKYGKEQDREILRQQGKLFMQIAALSDLLNKPATEHTLEILENAVIEFDIFSADIAQAIKKPNKGMLLKIYMQIDGLKKIIKQNYKNSALYDFKCIIYLLEELYGTLSIITSNA